MKRTSVEMMVLRPVIRLILNAASFASPFQSW